MQLRTLATSLALLLAGPGLARADFISGRVVDQNGIGVPGIDIDAIDLITEDQVTLFNDGTDPDGFFLTTIPPGYYEIIFNPPPPPTTTHLVTKVTGVVVVGTFAMGNVVLDPGVALSGNVVNTLAQPVANVNLDVFDEVLGMKIDIRNGFTDAFGNFSIAVPANALELQFDATPVLGQTLVSTRRSYAPTADLNVGTIVLEDGFTISGRVLDPDLKGLKDADIDVVDPATGNKLFTPGDGTDDLGDFSVTVPPGTWDVEICPPSDEVLVGTDFEHVLVASHVNLGTVVLEPGFVLTGTVTDGNGTPVADVDLDVESILGPSVVLCGDKTDANGDYSVVVPLGTFDVVFDPPFTVPYRRTTVSSVVITGNRIQSAVLPNCSLGSSLGGGSPGRGGIVPHLASQGGTPRAGNGSWQLSLQDGLGGASAVLVLALEDLDAPLLGGTASGGRRAGSTAYRLPSSTANLFLFPVQLGGTPGAAGAGTASFSLPVPLSFLVGETLVGQFAVFDSTARLGLALSDAYRVVIRN